MKRGAIFSECGTYRYQLWRIWDETETKPLVGFIGLNPSTADALFDDSTIKKLISFAFGWKYGGFYIGNLFAFRATDPRDMKKFHHPIGPYNDDHLRSIAARCEIMVAAWGNHGKHLKRDEAVCAIIPNLKCFRITGKGAPEHPLYLPMDLKPIDYLEAM